MAIAITRDHLTQSVMARFWSKVKKADGCWEWTASKHKRGYGTFSLHGRGASPVKAHRLAWVSANGDIPDGLEVCHSCDNPPCVNPAHLFLGTQQQNILDASAKGRLAGRTTPAGGNNPSAVLNEIQVRAIIARLIDGKTCAALAREYGVNRSTISLIKRRHNWPHLWPTT